MAPRADWDVAIVGGGMIGATLANLLARQSAGLRVVLINAAAPTPLRLQGFDPRVVALSVRSQRVLQAAEVWPRLAEARVCPYREMHVWDGEGTASIHFDSRALHREALGHIVENRVLVACLESALDSASGVALRFNATVESLALGEGRQVLTLADGEQLSASLVVAADGGHSHLREILGFRVREWDYGQRAIVTTVRCERAHDFTAWQRFTETGPIAFLPLSADGVEQQHCSLVWSLCEDGVDEVLGLSEQAFCERLTRAFEGRLGAVLGTDPRQCFPLRQCHATRYIRPGVALIGDAAHTIHPLAGQGANLGLYDVEVLSAEIARAVARGVALHDFSILRRYERQRQAHNLLTMGAMEGFKRLFGSRDIALRWLRNEGLRAVDGLPLIKNLLAKWASD